MCPDRCNVCSFFGKAFEQAVQKTQARAELHFFDSHGELRVVYKRGRGLVEDVTLIMIHFMVFIIRNFPSEILASFSTCFYFMLF